MDETQEAALICQMIRRLRLSAGWDYRDVAIFYRTNAQSRAIEDALRVEGIPYQIVGGLKFYERKEVKDLLAYLRMTVNPRDSVSLQARHQRAAAWDRQGDRRQDRRACGGAWHPAL